MTKPDINDSFVLNGENIQVEWYDTGTASELPDVPWQQVYAVGNLNGQVPIVLYEEDNPNLPGGKPEQGESIQETLHREMKEELHCQVTNWKPLGYQKLKTQNGETVYQLRVYAQLESIGEFTNDPGGNVMGYKLVDLPKLNDTIQYGKIGMRIMQLAAPLFSKDA